MTEKLKGRDVTPSISERPAYLVILTRPLPMLVDKFVSLDEDPHVAAILAVTYHEMKNASQICKRSLHLSTRYLNLLASVRPPALRRARCLHTRGRGHPFPAIPSSNQVSQHQGSASCHISSIANGLMRVIVE
jgi:hypothetical protein